MKHVRQYAAPGTLALILALPVTALAQEDWDDPLDEEPTYAPSEPEPAAASPEPAAVANGGLPVSEGTKGLSFAMPAGGAPTIGATYFLDETSAIRADVGFSFTSLSADNSGTGERETDFGLSLEVGYRMYQPVGNKLTTFLQPSIFLAKANTPGDFSDEIAAAVSGSIGVEYWFTDNWTLGGFTGLSLFFQNGFDDIALTTATSALFMSFYW